MFLFFLSSRMRHTRLTCDWSSDVCSSDLLDPAHRLQHQQRALVRLKLEPKYRNCGGRGEMLVPTATLHFQLRWRRPREAQKTDKAPDLVIARHADLARR